VGGGTSKRRELGRELLILSMNPYESGLVLEWPMYGTQLKDHSKGFETAPGKTPNNCE
jgi:hypothetical protein